MPSAKDPLAETVKLLSCLLSPRLKSWVAKKGFLKSELIDMFKSLKIISYKIMCNWAFRWLVVISKDQL